METYVEFLKKYHLQILALSLFISVFMMSTLPNLRIENPQGRMDLPATDPVAKAYRNFQKNFATGDMIVVMLEFERTLSKRQLDIIKRITDQLSRLKGIIAIASIANATRPDWQSASMTLIPLQSNTSDSVSIHRLSTFLIYEPMFKENIISGDGRSAAILLEFEPSSNRMMHGGQVHEQLIHDVEAIVHRQVSNSATVYMTGYPLLSLEFQKALRKNVSMFGGLSFLLIFIFLWFTLKQWPMVPLAFLLAMNALIWSLGMLSLSQVPLSIGLVVMIPLVPVLNIAYAIHFIAFFLHHRQPQDAFADHYHHMIVDILPPTLLTGLTTAVGFVSLRVSALPGVREMGLFLAVGVLISVIHSVLILPAVLWRMTAPLATATQNPLIQSGTSMHLKRIVNQQARWIMAMILLGSILGIAGLTKINVSTNHLYCFPESNQLRKSYHFQDDDFGGSLPVEITIETTPGDVSHILSRLPEFQKRLSELSGMGKTLSVYNAFRYADKWKPMSASMQFDLNRGIISPKIWQLMAETATGKKFIYADRERITLRVSARVRVVDSSRLKQLLTDVEDLCARSFPADQSTITGLVPLLVQTQSYVIDSQVYSFMIAFGCILLLFLLVSGSLKTGLLVTLANVTPILLVLGFMGWMKIPLDTITIFIASIAFGIIVDDAIHFIYRFRQKMKTTTSTSLAIGQTFDYVGFPIMSTSLIICGGFLVMIPSQFLPIRYFGMLAALTVMLALLANLFFLPVLLKYALGRHQKLTQ